MAKHYIISINNLVDTFSRVLAGKEFDFTLSTSESTLSDTTILEDDFLIVSIDDKVYYMFKVIDKSEEEIRLKKIFEIEESIGYKIEEKGKFQEITQQEHDIICQKLFSGFNSQNNATDTKLEIGNLKEDFADWFIKFNGSKHNYFKDSFNSDRDRLIQALSEYEDVYSQEFNSLIFSLPSDRKKKFIDSLEQNLYQESGEFFEFSKRKSTHMPRAILGKSNYLKFLKAKLENNQKSSQVSGIIKAVDNPIDFNLSKFEELLKNSGLIFSDQLIKRFIASLWTKPFVICSGLSGSGKTKLAQAFAMWICQDKSQYEIVPVGADWTNREPLLGYPNALDESSYVKPENGILQLILSAKANENLPYFLILDEMNLSHVERYFADFLSTMESKEAIPLHKIENEKSGTIPQKLALPNNLFIIGTVNIDETTYMFSPKVLDRANTIEFRLTEADLEEFIGSNIPLDLKKLEQQGATMAEDFVRISQSKTASSLDKYKDDIVKFFGELQKAGAEFGYRTTSEIGQLISHLESLGETNDNLLDIAIMQKLLPKLHGSRTKLTKTLVTLGGFCLKDSKDIKDNYFTPYVENSKDLNGDDNIKYKLSFEKICRMYKNAVENGFASYAEA
jgi:hypothetical protein